MGSGSPSAAASTAGSGSVSVSIRDSERSKLHQQISKKLIEIGDAQNDRQLAQSSLGAEREGGGSTTSHRIAAKSDAKRLRVGDADGIDNDGDAVLFDDAVWSEEAVRSLLLRPNCNGDVDGYCRYTEHLRAAHRLIAGPVPMDDRLASGSEQTLSVHSASSRRQQVIAEMLEDGVAINHHDVEHQNNLLPSTPMMAKPFLFESTPEVVAKYDASALDLKSLKSIKSNTSPHHKITDFRLYKSNIICSIGKGIGYAKLRTPSQRRREGPISASASFASTASVHSKHSGPTNSRMVTRSFAALKTKSSLSALSVLHQDHLLVVGTQNGKVFTCG